MTNINQRGESHALSSPNNPSPLYKGIVKLPRKGLRTISTRGTKSFVIVEFESTHIPAIQLEIIDANS